jgi:hypothetical protein
MSPDLRLAFAAERYECAQAQWDYCQSLWESRNVLLCYDTVCLRVLSDAVHFNGGNNGVVRDWFELDRYRTICNGCDDLENDGNKHAPGGCGNVKALTDEFPFDPNVHDSRTDSCTRKVNLAKVQNHGILSRSWDWYHVQKWRWRSKSEDSVALIQRAVRGS